MTETEECKVCYGRHSDAIHRATRSIHNWLRQQLQARFEPVPVPKLRTTGNRRTELSIKPRETG
jgi:hypothetical protein